MYVISVCQVVTKGKALPATDSSSSSGDMDYKGSSDGDGSNDGDNDA